MFTKHNDQLITTKELAETITARDLWKLSDAEIAILLTHDRTENIKTLAFCPEDIQKARKVSTDA